MILAAGLGTRLRPLTNETPKALIDIGGMPMLERVARRLVDAGASRLIINVHHHADQVRNFIEEKDGFGVEVYISEEPEEPLETGGGIKNAARHFTKEAPFLVHNSDILSDINLRALFEAQTDADALATLATREAESQRYLIFDEAGLCGYTPRDENREVYVRDPQGEHVHLDFCGVQAVSPRIFNLMTETGVFSIINTYLRLAKAGETVQPFRVDGTAWMDIGTHERLEEARSRFA